MAEGTSYREIAQAPEYEEEKRDKPEIRRELESLDATVRLVNEIAGKFEAAVEPVLSPAGADVEGVDPALNIETPIGKHIREIHDTAHMALRRLRGAYHRVQV
jgi:hypothetical protein